MVRKTVKAIRVPNVLKGLGLIKCYSTGHSFNRHTCYKSSLFLMSSLHQHQFIHCHYASIHHVLKILKMSQTRPTPTTHNMPLAKPTFADVCFVCFIYDSNLTSLSMNKSNLLSTSEMLDSTHKNDNKWLMNIVYCSKSNFNQVTNQHPFEVNRKNSCCNSELWTDRKLTQAQ